MTLALIEQLALIRAGTLSLLVVVEIIRQKRNAVISGKGRGNYYYITYDNEINVNKYVDV